MNQENEYQDVSKLYSTYQIKQANEAIDLGWRLLKVLAKNEEQEYSEYILGWSDKKGEPQYPKTHYASL